MRYSCVTFRQSKNSRYFSLHAGGAGDPQYREFVLWSQKLGAAIKTFSKAKFARQFLVVVVALKGQRNFNKHVPFVSSGDIEYTEVSFLSRKEFEYFCPKIQVDQENY
jgi:hypothetical protein